MNTIEEEAPPGRRRRRRYSVEFKAQVVFTDKHMSERVGIIVPLNGKTASIAVNKTDGHWRVSYALLRKTVDI